MQTLKAVNPSEAREKARELLAAAEQRLQRSSNMMRVMANSAAILAAYLRFNAAFEDVKMTAKLRALITTAVAELNGCDYTLSVAMVLGRHVGLSEQELNAARQMQAGDPKAGAALHFAECLVQERGRVPAAEVETLRSFGFSDEEIVEIVALVCLNLFRNYLNLVAGTEIDFPVVRSKQQLPVQSNTRTEGGSYE
jgi:AhpD family alkylhydroperoxidase